MQVTPLGVEQDGWKSSYHADPVGSLQHRDAEQPEAPPNQHFSTIVGVPCILPHTCNNTRWYTLVTHAVEAAAQVMSRKVADRPQIHALIVHAEGASTLRSLDLGMTCADEAPLVGWVLFEGELLEVCCGLNCEANCPEDTANNV